MSETFKAPVPAGSGQLLLNPLGITLNSRLQIADLFYIIFKRLHPLFSLDHAAILIYDDAHTAIQEAFTSSYNADTGVAEKAINDRPVALSAQQKLVAAYNFPVLKTSQEWVEETGGNHQPINSHLAYQYHCYVPLEVGNRILGTFELHNLTEELSTECLAFSCSIGDLFADIIAHQLKNINVDRDKHTPPAKSHDAGLPLQVATIDEATTLEDFFSRCATLFPTAMAKIQRQIDELSKLDAQLEDAGLQPGDPTTAANNYPEIIGASAGMLQVFHLLDQVADSESTVLILGETGTGKEVIAKAIHEHSGRKNNAMISVNCAAIPPNLIESELFGHEKGSFTGATDRRIGKFELAENGTLFLDEVGELPLDMQVKLLRVLQEREFERVGGKGVIKCNVRVLSATNRNLQYEVEKGRFRRDLYFRLNVIPIQLPALRERADDIPLLAYYFLNKYARKAGRQVTGFSKGAIKKLRGYNWPGNVREMEHLIERHVLLNKTAIIGDINLPDSPKMLATPQGAPQRVKTIDENERDHIFNVLQLCKGRISGPDGAAKLLGVPATTLNSKIKRLGLNKKHF